jgi:hypothetical protein
MAASRHWLQLRQALAQAEQAVQKAETAVEEAKREFEQARIEQETFDTHREEELAEHGRTAARRQQVVADQEWLARPGKASQQEARREA